MNILTRSMLLNFLFVVTVISRSLSVKALNYCSASKENEEDFLCLEDEFNVRSGFRLGVEQRVEGTDEEKKEVRAVLKQMNKYIVQELSALPEYGNALQQCWNHNGLCAFWASVGECESNREFMLKNCALACRFCLLLGSGMV